MSLLNQKSSMTLLAGALLFGLSACANRPIVDPDSRLGKAGDKFGEVSTAFWVKTKHVFRLDGTDAYANPPRVAKKTDVEMPAEFKDELDLALIDDEFQSGPGANDEITLIAVDTNSAIKVEDDEPAAIEVVTFEPVNEELASEELASGELIIDEVAIDTTSEPLAENPVIMAKTDLDYEVQANENLWDISKRLTGDAMNWRDLAALNSLDPSGTVYGGQKLHIPGDMLKPDVIEPTVVAAIPADVTGSSTDTATSRLKVPTATAVDAVSDIVVAKAEAPVIPNGPKTSFKVLAGETMWDLAKRTTGDATNWKTIAAANGLSEADAALIKYGQSLNVPDDLLEYGTASGTEVASAETAGTPTPADVPVAEAAPAVESEVTEIAVAETAAGTEQAEEELTIMPAKFQSEPPVIKVDEPAVAAATAEQPTDWIMVSGTYYPKAIYNDANFSATLLTRVSPGTKLQVSRAIGPWYEVKTDRGMGYVHSRDIK